MTTDVDSPGRATEPHPKKSAIIRRFRAFILELFTRPQTWPLLASLLVPLAFCALMLKYSPYDTVFEFDPDEGNNVIKALLLEHGYRFSDEIWSDQPPLFSTLLRLTFMLFGWEPAVGRLLVLGFAGVLVWVVFDTLRRSAGVVPALTGAALLMLSAEFIPLSVSIMIGLPAICWGALAFWALGHWFATSRRRWLAISAVMIGLSVATKMFTAFLVPLLAACVVLSARYRSSDERHSVSPRARWTEGLKLGSWFCTVLAVVLVVTLWPVLSAKDPASLIRAHLIAREAVTAVDDLTGARMIPRFLRGDATIIALAWLGVLHALSRRSAIMLAWSGWFVCALVSLYFHQPVWIHHRLLITVPGAVLAGWGLAATLLAEPSLVADVRQRRWRARGLRALLGVLIVGSVALGDPDRLEAISKPQDFGDRDRDEAFQGRIDEYVEFIDMMVSSRQMYAFRAGVPVPPELAVTSIKRFHSGLLSTSDIVGSIEKHRPGMVVLTARWPVSVRRDVRKLLLKDYTKVYEDPLNMRAELWLRPEVAEKASRR